MNGTSAHPTIIIVEQGFHLCCADQAQMYMSTRHRVEREGVVHGRGLRGDSQPLFVVAAEVLLADRTTRDRLVQPELVARDRVDGLGQDGPGPGALALARGIARAVLGPRLARTGAAGGEGGQPSTWEG